MTKEQFIWSRDHVYELSTDTLPPIGHCDQWGKILAFSPKSGWRCIPRDKATLHALGHSKEEVWFSPCTHYKIMPEPPTWPEFMYSETSEQEEGEGV